MKSMTNNSNITARMDRGFDPRYFSLAFGAGNVALSTADSEDLRRWVAFWLAEESSREMIVGFDDDVISPGRRRRLEAVAQALEVSGMPRRQIRFATGAMGARPPAETADLPADNVVVRSIGSTSANSQVRPLESLVRLAAVQEDREPACTSAS